MRDFKGMKRQRGRNRGGGGQGGKPQHNANRAFDSNGPEGVKVRGAAQSVFEKYQQLARDAASSGDRILAENYQQHAEHYFRTLRAMQPHRPVADIVGREQFASGFDIDFEAEPEELPEAPAAEATDAGEGAEGGEGGQQREGQQQRFEGRRDRDRDRDGQRFEGRRDRDDRPRNNEDRQREDRPRDDRPRDERPREEREGGSRRDRWRDRDGRRERGEGGERAAESNRDPLAVVEPQAAAPLAEAPSGESPRLRGQDGAMSELPAFLGRPATPAAEEETPAAEAKKPRRRRAPRSFEGGEAPAETEEA